MNLPPVVVSYCIDCTEIELVRALLRHYGQPFQERRMEPGPLANMTRGLARIHLCLHGAELLTVEALMLHLLRRRGCVS